MLETEAIDQLNAECAALRAWIKAEFDALKDEINADSVAFLERIVNYESSSS